MCDACALQEREDILHMIKVSLLCFAEYDYILEVNVGELPFNANQDHILETMKYAGCVAESE